MVNRLFLMFFYLGSVCFATDNWPYGVFHVFGDSHAGFGFTNCKTWLEFTSQPPPPSMDSSNFQFGLEQSFYHFKGEQIPFAIHWLGSYTMHRLGRDGVNLSAYGVKSNDVALFLLGEIDCRIHVGRQVYLKDRNLKEVIGTLAKSYVEKVLKNQEDYGIRCVICAVPPPSISSFHINGIDYGEYNPLLPSVPLSERVGYVKMLNEEVQKTCNRLGVLFVSPYEDFIDDTGILSPDYSDGGNHVRIEFNSMIKDMILGLLMD